MVAPQTAMWKETNEKQVWAEILAWDWDSHSVATLHVFMLLSNPAAASFHKIMRLQLMHFRCKKCDSKIWCMFSLTIVNTTLLLCPVHQIKKLKELRAMLMETDPCVAVTVRKLVMVSLMEIFKDIVPSYRIRPLTETEKNTKVQFSVWDPGKTVPCSVLRKSDIVLVTSVHPLPLPLIHQSHEEAGSNSSWLLFYCCLSFSVNIDKATKSDSRNIVWKF